MLATMQFRISLSSCLLLKNANFKIYSTIILRVVSYGCEIWSVIIRKETDRLNIFEHRLLRRTFGPKRDEVRRGWTK
jgi:hypothetical protein